MSFFDTTPSGRILNRFSADIDKIDHSLTRLFEAYGGCIFFVLGTVIALCVVYVYFFAPLLIVTAMYYYVQQYFVRSSLEIQRLESVTKSPIFSHFGESLAGASTLRAFGIAHLRRCMDQSVALLDENHRMVLTSQLCQCWLGVRLETISTVLTVLCAIYAVATRSQGNPGLVGLSIVYALTITGFLNGAVRLSSMIEATMSSVQRVHEYAFLPSEAAAHTTTEFPTDWPSAGAIAFNNFSMR
jgi:ATP-binding cassette subfamily C (CFTR/MRP) protein 1